MNDKNMCIKCGLTIPTKRSELGYNTCIECSDEKRYVGRRYDKHGDVEIYRVNQEYFAKMIRRENKICYNANLPFSSPNSIFVNHGQMEKQWLQSIKIDGEKEGGEKDEK